MNSNKIKGKIVEQGLTQAKLAKQMGLSLQTINAKLNNRRPFTIYEAYQITEILHLENPSDIFLITISQKCNKVKAPNRRQPE